MDINILDLFLGAVLGAVFGYVFQAGYDKTREKIRLWRVERRRAFVQKRRVSEWLIEYYGKKGHSDDLFDCRMGDFEVKIPFLTKREWQYSSAIYPASGEILQYTETINPKFQVDKRLLKKRRYLGQTLFNQPILYLDRIERSGNSLWLHVKSCDYFQAFTSLARLEEETFQAVKKASFWKPSIRDAYFSNLSQIERLQQRPFNMGCSTVLAIVTRQGYEVVIQTRSHSTVTFGGAKAVIPTFGLTPITGPKRNTNLFYYNFLKEYCEELFNYEELIAMMNTKRANSYWFYELPEARELNALQEKGLFTLEFLGFGFDALNGSALASLLAVIHDVEYSEKIKSSIMTNWEVAERTSDLEPIEFIDFRSPKLENWLRENQFHYGSAFAISLAIRRLKEMTR